MKLFAGDSADVLIGNRETLVVELTIGEAFALGEVVSRSSEDVMGALVLRLGPQLGRAFVLDLTSGLTKLLDCLVVLMESSEIKQALRVSTGAVHSRVQQLRTQEPT